MSGNSPFPEAQTRNYDLDAYELKGDIRHGRDQTCKRDGEGEGGTAKALSHEICRGEVTGTVTDAPESGHDSKDERID